MQFLDSKGSVNQEDNVSDINPKSEESNMPGEINDDDIPF